MANIEDDFILGMDLISCHELTVNPVEKVIMLFGLRNAPATFKRLMEMLLQGLTWKTCLVYLDDMMVMGNTFEEDLAYLEKVLVG